jgi:hypothetical protein
MTRAQNRFSFTRSGGKLIQEMVEIALPFAHPQPAINAIPTFSTAC